MKGSGSEIDAKMNCKAFGRQSLPGEVQEIITCMVTDIRYISTLHIQFENMSRPGHVGGVMSPESWHSQSWLLHDDHQRKLGAAVHGGCSGPRAPQCMSMQHPCEELKTQQTWDFLAPKSSEKKSSVCWWNYFNSSSVKFYRSSMLSITSIYQ